MKISQKEFNALKKVLLDTWFMARDCGAVFMMEYLDYAMQILQDVEVNNIKEKQRLM